MEVVVRSLTRPIVVLILAFAVISAYYFLCYDTGAVAASMAASARVGRGFLSWGIGMEEGEVGGQGVDGCDLFEGEWVWDETYPLYESTDCAFLMDDGFRCTENGRPDRSYTKWRWQPARCNLSRFDAKKMLEKLRNRRVIFAGDSIGRNQWESLLCMLSAAIPDKRSIYEVNGNPITKHMGYLVFKFKDYNCTVEYYRAPFLVMHGHTPPGVSKRATSVLKLDAMDSRSTEWRNADMLVLNTAHWWSYDKTIKRGIYFQEGNEVKTEMSVESAYQRSIKTLFDWIQKEVNKSKTQVIFRTYSHTHFRNGTWKTGGGCHLETLPELGFLDQQMETWSHLMKPFMNFSLENYTPKAELEVLNITRMTAPRKDAHISLYYNATTSHRPLNKQDCSHWCLPGVPDAWNEILYTLFLRRESMINRNSTISTRHSSDGKRN